MWGLVWAVPVALATLLVGSVAPVALTGWLSEGRWRSASVILLIWPYMFIVVWLTWAPIAIATGQPMLGMSR